VHCAALCCSAWTAVAGLWRAKRRPCTKACIWLARYTASAPLIATYYRYILHLPPKRSTFRLSSGALFNCQTHLHTNHSPSDDRSRLDCRRTPLFSGACAAADALARLLKHWLLNRVCDHASLWSYRSTSWGQLCWLHYSSPLASGPPDRLRKEGPVGVSITSKPRPLTRSLISSASANLR